MSTNILIMAHGLLYMDEHNNTIPFHSPNTTVITVAPMARTSWSNVQVEYALIMALHRNIQDPHPVNKPFSKIVRESSNESGVMSVINTYPTHIPKSFGKQTNEIANKFISFENNEGEEKDPYYGIWWLDDPESPLNLLAMPGEIKFPKIGGREMYYFSDIVETLKTHFPNSQINILDYSCSSCLYPDSQVVRNSNDRQVRRLSRGLTYSQIDNQKKSRKRKLESPKKNRGETRRRRKISKRTT